jgi:aryl-alcohol dehydrogenase-like predicted oxidoreductase
VAQTIDRRNFLKLGAASAGLAVGCGSGGEESTGEVSPQEMRYRRLGATGLEVSEITFGAHGVDNPPLMAAALEAGINTFFTSGNYMDGREEEALGEALARIGTPRDRVVIVTGDTIEPGDTVDSILQDFDASLRRLRTDYLDVYCNGMVETPSDVHVDVLFEAFDRARKAGKVRHLGLSGHHGGLQACLEAGIEAGRYDAFLTKYDFVSYPDQDELLHRAAAQGIGIMVFKVNAGNRQREIKDLEAGGLSFQQATLRWALSNPNVSTVAVTMTNFQHIQDCVTAVGSSISRPEIAMLRRYADEMYDQYCRFCATCEATCPSQVAVADVMRYAMYFTYYGREKEAMRLYRELPEPSRGAACESCSGPCDAACPFGRQVRAGMIEAHQRLDWREA